MLNLQVESIFHGHMSSEMLTIISVESSHHVHRFLITTRL